MSRVDMFKYYASKLNLSKPQLEAVTDCFKACFEAEADGAENINPKVQDETTPSEKRQPHVPFSEADHLHTFPENDMANLFKTNNARLARAMKAKTSVPQVNAKDQNRIMKYGSNTLAENYANTVDLEEKRQAENAAQRQQVMNLQRKLNKALGINLAVDGIKGPQTIAAEKRYRAMLAGSQQYAANQSNETANAARVKYAGTPEPVESDTDFKPQYPDMTQMCRDDARTPNPNKYRNDPEVKWRATLAGLRTPADAMKTANTRWDNKSVSGARYGAIPTAGRFRPTGTPMSASNIDWHMQQPQQPATETPVSGTPQRRLSIQPASQYRQYQQEPIR